MMWHLRACKHACVDDKQLLSFASDSSRVGSFGIMTAIGVLPSGVGFSMCPQAG